MPYAIMRFEKRKGGPASAIEKHHERKKPRYASNPDVDTDRSHLNYHLVEPRHKYYAEIQSRIEQAQRKNPKLKVRRDSVKFIDTIVTATPDYLTQLMDELRACQTFIDSIPQDLLEQIKQRQAQRMEQGQGQQLYL